MTRFTRELEELKKLADNRDTEVAHLNADGILCDILKKLGEEDIVKAYNAVKKWYA